MRRCRLYMLLLGNKVFPFDAVVVYPPFCPVSKKPSKTSGNFIV